MRPNASQWVRMDPKASKNSRKPGKTCENFENLRKNFEKLREKFYKNFFHGVVTIVSAPPKKTVLASGTDVLMAGTITEILVRSAEQVWCVEAARREPAQCDRAAHAV